MALPLETRGRSATVAAMQSDIKPSASDTSEQTLLEISAGQMVRTSSDSHIAAKSSANAASELQASSGGDGAPPATLPDLATAERDAERAIAEAKAVRAELDANADGSAASATTAQASSSAGGEQAAKSNASADAEQSTATATGEPHQAHVHSGKSASDEVDGTNEASSARVASTSSAGGKSGAVKFDPWLDKVIPEEDSPAVATSPTSVFSRTRFFGPSSNKEPVATRVSRWMPFDSASDAKAASRRSASDWWQTPEEQRQGTTSTTQGAQVTELAPTNPFAADVKASTPSGDKEASLAAGVTENSAETGDAPVAAASMDDEELSPADSAVTSNAAAASASDEIQPAGDSPVKTLVSSTALDEKNTETAWKLMLKSALLSHAASRDKQSSAVEFHPYIVLLKENKLVVHHASEFFRETGGSKKPVDYAAMYDKRQHLMEIKLEPSMRFGAVERRRVTRDSRARLHIVKLQSWQQREFTGLRALFGASSRTEVRTVLKVGCASLTTLESFMESVDKQIRVMPVDTTQEVSFRRDEIFCDFVDDCDIQLAFDGTLLSRRSTVHVMVQAYLSGQSECQLIINDRKLANMQRNNSSGLFLPPSKELIDMNKVECHSATNREVFEESRLVRFTCLQGLRFEALRFQVTGSLPPPLEVRGLLCETVDNSVNLRANLQWHAQTGRVRHAVHDVEFHIPVPSDWSGVLETKNALGMRRSIKAQHSFRGSLRRKRQTASATLDVSTGTAKYEPESGALVWRIDDFPTERDAHATLTCRLELPKTMDKPDFTDKQCIMKYGVAGSCVSGATVWSLHTPPVQVKPVKKWVKYDTKFRYTIDMLPSSKYEIAGEDD